MKYVFPAIFETAAEGGFVVSFPDLPGCYSQGDNLDDSLTMAHSALEQWIGYLADKGQTIPEASQIEDIEVDEKKDFAFLIQALIVDRDTLVECIAS